MQGDPRARPLGLITIHQNRFIHICISWLHCRRARVCCWAAYHMGGRLALPKWYLQKVHRVMWTPPGVQEGPDNYLHGRQLFVQRWVGCCMCVCVRAQQRRVEAFIRGSSGGLPGALSLAGVLGWMQLLISPWWLFHHCRTGELCKQHKVRSNVVDTDIRPTSVIITHPIALKLKEQIVIFNFNVLFS